MEQEDHTTLDQPIVSGFWYIGLLIALLTSFTALFFLEFNLIDFFFSNDYTNRNFARESSTFFLALFAVSFPILCYISYRVGKVTIDTHTTRLLRVIAGLAYGLIFVVFGLVAASSVVALLGFFLNGELGLELFLKTVIVFATIVPTLWYYRRAQKGYWLHHANTLRYQTVIVSVIYVAVFVAGVIMINPFTVKDRQEDDSVLYELRYAVGAAQDHYREHGSLLESENEILDRRIGDSVDYTPQGTNEFELCATFLLPSFDHMIGGYPERFKPFIHEEAGRYCFTFSITADGSESTLLDKEKRE